MKENDVMGFLNEIGGKFPKAISFASGRPDNRFFKLKESLTLLLELLENDTSSTGDMATLVGQYNRAQGIIQESLKKYYKTDYNWEVNEKDILITVGAQEAMALAIQVICENGKYAVAFEDPSYIGFSKYANLTGVEGVNIPMDATNTLDLNHLEEQLKIQFEKGKPIKLVNIIPDFQNPTGALMPLEKRKKILELAEEFDFYLFEDNAYGIFQYEGERLPFVKQLDTSNRVIYVESFSKSLFPSIRMASVICPTEMTDENGVSYLKRMVEFKGYVTVNTSTLNQMILSEILKSSNYSLREYNKLKVQDLRSKRDALIGALQENASSLDYALSWSTPHGGFFLIVKTPFEITQEDVLTAASEFNVIFSPLHFFATNPIDIKSIRLAFSELSPEKLVQGVNNLITFLNHKSHERK